MRRLYLSLLMPLLMLLSQQGAAWHEIGHWSQSSEQQQQQRKSDPTDRLCASCLAFAHLAATARSDPLPLMLAEASHVQAPVALPASLSATAPAARSRGPPPVL